MGGMVPPPPELYEDGRHQICRWALEAMLQCSKQSVVFAFHKAPYLREMAPVALETDRAALTSQLCPCLALQFQTRCLVSQDGFLLCDVRIALPLL